MSDEALPIEDRENGLYLNRATEQRPDGLRVLTLIDGADNLTPRYYVAAEAFMELQMERDGLRRAMGLINAWRFAHFVEFGPTSRLDGEHRRTLQRLLADEGFGDEDARAMLGIIRGLGKSV